MGNLPVGSHKVYLAFRYPYIFRRLFDGQHLTAHEELGLQFLEMLEYLAKVAVSLHEGTDGLDALHSLVNRAFSHFGEQVAHVLHPLEGGYKF